MKLHKIQKKLLSVLPQIDTKKMSLRDIAYLVDESHPQKIRHHLTQLEKKGYINLDMRSGKIKKTGQSLKVGGSIIAVPIYGCADCGVAKIFAEQNLEGYLRVSKKMIGDVNNIFAVKAQGPSMNRAKVAGEHSIEDGDYVLIDPNNKSPRNGDYVLSVINETANIKRFVMDKQNKQIALVSETSEDIQPIIIHADDIYMINGLVKNVIKMGFLRDWVAMQDSAGKDALESIGNVSDEEASYYKNLK